MEKQKEKGRFSRRWKKKAILFLEVIEKKNPFEIQEHFVSKMFWKR